MKLVMNRMDQNDRPQAEAEARHRKPPRSLPSTATARFGRAGAATGQQRCLKVLVVEHRPEHSRLLVERLQGWGHLVRTAVDGYEALRIAAIQHPDVAILNLTSPFMDGHRLSCQLRRDFPPRDLLIIGLGHRVDARRREAEVDSGIDLLLAKQVDPEIIETLLLLEWANLTLRRSVAADVSLPLVDEEVRDFECVW